jgi:hypothetical protein
MGFASLYPSYSAPNLGMTTGSSPMVTRARRHQPEHSLPQLQKSAADAL